MTTITTLGKSNRKQFNVRQNSLEFTQEEKMLDGQNSGENMHHSRHYSAVNHQEYDSKPSLPISKEANVVEEANLLRQDAWQEPSEQELYSLTSELEAELMGDESWQASEDDATSTFCCSIVGDYIGLGLATRIDETSMGSLDGSNVVLLEPMFDGDRESGVNVFSNGVLVGSFEYSMETQFAKKFGLLLAGLLNI